MATVINATELTEISNCLTNLGIWSYSVGGKCKAAYQSFYEICMATLAGTPEIVTPAAQRTRRSRNVVTMPAAEPPRRRGRPPGSTAVKTQRVRKPAVGMSPQNQAILKCIAAGFTTPAAMVPELKRTYGITKRPNHLGLALARLTRAGQLTQDGLNWFITPTGREMAKAA